MHQNFYDYLLAMCDITNSEFFTLPNLPSIWCIKILGLRCDWPVAGDRSRLKMLAREMNEADVKDNAGNTPLMYAVMGRQSKVQ